MCPGERGYRVGELPHVDRSGRRCTLQMRRYSVVHVASDVAPRLATICCWIHTSDVAMDPLELHLVQGLRGLAVPMEVQAHMDHPEDECLPCHVVARYCPTFVPHHLLDVLPVMPLHLAKTVMGPIHLWNRHCHNPGGLKGPYVGNLCK